ncbi:protein hobbit [Cylas formicarius]|uniref:protein hobbit n=1 Tax=Cylas formicarius TaxID=197179 RepID=UPI002958A09B|nr:protein hobbit [Cylas formicarius]
MNMLILFAILVVVFFSVSRLLPLVLSWLFEKKYKVPLKIGKIGLPYLTLCDITLSKNGFVIHISEVSIKSSFLNSELTKLITLVIKDVNIKDTRHIKPSKAAHNVEEKKLLDFREKKVPYFINSFAQFMAVHIYNTSYVSLLDAETSTLSNTFVRELHLDGSILKNAKSLLVTLNIIDAQIHIVDQVRHNQLADFGFAIAMETILVAQGPLSVEKLDVKMSHSKVILRSNFYSLLQQADQKHMGSSDGRKQSFSDSEDDVLDRILPVVPKNCSLHIDNTSFKGYNKLDKIEYVSDLKSLALNYRPVQQTERNSVLFNFYLTDLVLETNSDRAVELKSLNVDARLKNNVINIYLQQHNLMITYNHSVMCRWITSNFLRRSSATRATSNLNPSAMVAKKRKSMLENVIKDIMINFCAEISNVMAIVKLKGDNTSSIGFNKVRLMLDQVADIRGSQYRSYYANLLLNNRHWQTELLVESFWWSFKEWNNDTQISKVLHVWGTPIYLGMALIKFCTSEDEHIKLYCLLDTVQLEWSLELADYALLALKSMMHYRIPLGGWSNKKATDGGLTNLISNVVVTHFNCFLQSQNNEYFVSRLDAVSVDTSLESSSCKFEEFKLFTLQNTGDYYTCIRTEDILNYKIFLKVAHFNYVEKMMTREFNLSLLDNIVTFWSANFHLKALLLYKDIKDFCTTFKEHLPQAENAGAKPDKMPLNVLNCNVFGKMELNVDINRLHKAKITIDDVSLTKHFAYYLSDLSYAFSSIGISIDESDIFELKGVSIKRLRKENAYAKALRQERREAGCADDFNNNTFVVFIELFKAVFPHEHNYAEAVRNHFQSIFKWLKILHGRKNDGTPKNPRLMSPDFLVNVKEFLLEMSDDPFEVRLRDNFELLVDEYNESVKRQKMLKEKIAELLKTHLHMPAGKVEELYATLKKKNADIYIQRSKLMYQAAPQRTRLFAWSMVDVEIMVMLDWNQLDPYDRIRAMDPDSQWPGGAEENVEFSTIWCRHASLRCLEWKFQLRDFPQPLLHIKKIYLCGQIAGAEELAPKRATRFVTLDLGEPFEPVDVARSMQPLKFYYDLNCEIESFSYAFGPCWEPVIAQCNLSFNKISPLSRDPSPPLTFWDKMRLLMHGRLTMVVQQLQVLLHASLDPYNTTEEMALTWEKVVMDWTNAKLVFKGDLNIFVRTASKYDDVQLLKLPNLKLILGFQWVCLGDPNDHRSVVYCAPDKIPEYSSNQVHDSFRAFRSQNLNLSITLETKPCSSQPSNSCPILLLYGSTLKWIESLKLILSGVTRPTRRGRIFGNLRPRKQQLSRHYKKVNLLVGFHQFQVCYWMSFAMHRGCELFGGRLSSSSEHSLSLIPIDDGLKHRPKAEWSIVYMNSELNDSEIWLKSALEGESEIETPRLQPVEKCYCLSVAKVSYGREAVLGTSSERNKDTPTHRLVVYDLRGAWTKSNRNVVFALFDAFMKNLRMKKNLSTEALKGFRKDTNTTPLKRRSDSTGTPTNTAIQAIQSTTTDTPSPISKIQSGHAANMLQQLIAEADNNSIVYSDDLSAVSRQQHLQGVQACQEEDVLHKKWQISLVNAQVLLKGCETNGYVILSAAKAEIVQRIHRPAWKDRTLVSKTTWTGSLECMQYYATVNAGDSDAANENIMWLTVDNIQEKGSAEISEPSEVPNMVGSGVSVGAVVSDTVGPSSSRQLQRIVSRCRCEFFYAGYGDISVDPEGIAEIPPPPQEDVSPWDSRHKAVDAFTLMHHDLDVCTNSLQYAMLLDVINNLLLYVEPHRKEALEKLARMRFQLQLHSVDDQRRPIQEKQTLVRSTMNKLRRLEKDTYMVNKALEESPEDLDLRHELDRLERLMHDCKNHLNAQSEELDMMLSCYKETQLLMNARMATTRSDKPLTVVRANEICFKHAQWRLTEADGQIGIADLVLSNFLYTKNSKSDDSVEHLLELGYLRMTNLLPNEIHKEVICPTEIQYDMPIEHKKVLRIFCREKSPVGGISVKEHFEINLVPLTIGLTKKFYNTMMKFSFPERDSENADYNDRASEDGDAEPKNKKSKSKKKSDSNFYVHIDDVEKMKERAEKNKLFVYIKIPEVPVKVSYKGTKEKNLEDLRDVSIVIPTLEYHNMTWTWLDLLMAIRNDTKRVILSQAIKQKLQIKRNTGTGEDSSTPQDEDKAKMLLGSRHAPENRSTRKKVSGVFGFGK